jgi:hypothetical protein
MCNDKLIRLRENIEQRKVNNLRRSTIFVNPNLPSVKLDQVYKFMANEDDAILSMIYIMIGDI